MLDLFIWLKVTFTTQVIVVEVQGKQDYTDKNYRAAVFLPPLIVSQGIVLVPIITKLDILWSTVLSKRVYLDLKKCYPVDDVSRISITN